LNTCSVARFVSRIYADIYNIFGSRREDVTGEWRRLHNEELYALYCSSNIVWGDQVKKNEMGNACSTYGEERCVQGFGAAT
jgi:hypothetical protein